MPMGAVINENNSREKYESRIDIIEMFSVIDKFKCHRERHTKLFTTNIKILINIGEYAVCMNTTNKDTSIEEIVLADF